MRNAPKPLLKLDRAAKLYWAVITKIKPGEWSEADRLMASQLCRDFAALEEISRETITSDGERLEAADALLRDLCARIVTTSRALGLLMPAATVAPMTAQGRIVAAVLAEATA